MLAPNIRHPKEVTVRVLKAENLRVAPRSDHKQKKVSHKWKVVVLGGKKKVTSEAVFAPDGNPIWNFETTIKIATRGDPVVLLIADSEDNHAGQVVVSGAAIPPKITDSSVGPTDSSRLCIMDMEQTKKTEVGFGRLYFWIWVEEYRSEESKSKSSRGSVLSLSSLHHKDKASIPNSLNYSGSVISLSSNHGDSKDKKSWYKKKASQALHAAASLSSARSPVIPVSNKKTVISGYNPFDYYLQSPHDDVGVIDEKDGSVLGAYSELTGSDFNPLARQSLHFTNDKPINPSSPLSTVSQSIHPQPPPSEQNGKLLSSNIVDNSLDINEPSKPRPELIRIAPKCGPSSGGTELTVYCRSLTNKNMQGASVFVDDHEVSRQDWVFQESDQPDRSQLRIHMPALPAGRYPICVNTSEFGQIRCKQEFTYLQSNTNPVSSPASSLFDSSMNESSNNKPITITPKSKNIDANGGVIFNRTGSQTSNLILVDRRSGRRDRIKRPEVLGRSDSLSSSTLEVSSHMEAKNNPGNAALVINSNVNGGLNKNQGKLVVTNSNDSPVYDETIKSPVTIKVSKAIHSEPTHFIRVGSQKSELLLQDRRSKRGNRRLPVKMVGNDAEEVDSSSHDLQKLNSTSIVSSTKSTNDTNFMDNQLFLNKPEKNIVKTEISSPDLLSEASQFNPLSDTYDISTPLSLCEEFSDQLTESQMNYSSTINGKMMSSEVLPPLTKTPLTYGNFSDSIDEVHTCSTTQKSSDHFGTLINEQRDTISANAGWKEKGEEKEEEAYLCSLFKYYS
uniref:IPT/TIG domain-containing protein n=1 Tax=Trichobilharzia regenti TaxID=157069 RepID=A0AA85JT07_TRIRE|nr:unnamed protein product [Trichobilharzia regenti]